MAALLGDRAEANLFYPFIDDLDGSKFMQYWHEADRGDVVSMLKLAFCYAERIGTEQDMEQAKRWSKEAARRGNPIAMTLYGSLANDVKMVEKGAKGGDYTAYFMLGDWFYYENKKKFEAFKKGAEKGNVPCMTKVAWCYLCNFGTVEPQNVEKAKMWAEKALERGDAFAMYLMAHLYREWKKCPMMLAMNADLIPQYWSIVEDNEQLYREWLVKAYENGSRYAAYELACISDTDDDRDKYYEAVLTASDDWCYSTSYTNRLETLIYYARQHFKARESDDSEY